eukprot:m.134843 g.134843  ORF g.134843 m.134843 type:complete len:82 (-) comp14702_c0_seq1:407-652(-)
MFGKHVAMENRKETCLRGWRHLGGDFSSRINDCTVLYNASKTISFCSGHKMSIFLDASIMLIQLRTKQATTQLELQPGLKC